MTPLLVTYLGFDKPFVLETNASFVALGIVLSQKKEDGEIHPV